EMSAFTGMSLFRADHAGPRRARIPQKWTPVLRPECPPTQESSIFLPENARRSTPFEPRISGLRGPLFYRRERRRHQQLADDVVEDLAVLLALVDDGERGRISMVYKPRSRCSMRT